MASWRATLLSFLLFCLSYGLSGQKLNAFVSREQKSSFSRAYLEERLAIMMELGEITGEEAKLLQQRYENFLLTPLDVNHLTAEDLQSIPLISSYQVYQFITYRLGQRDGLQDLSELKHIEAWDEDFVEYMYPLLHISGAVRSRTSLNDLLSGGKTRLSVLGTLPLVRSDREKKYIGSPEGLNLKYRWQNAKRISLFFAADKNNYEPWHHGQHKGFDSYHAHAMLRDFGKLRQFILGQYRLSWSEGLVLSQGFHTRSAFASGRNALQVCQATASTSSYSLSQGVFIDFTLSRSLRLGALASLRKVDARVEEEDRFYALSESGLHRTEQDWQRRNSVTQRHLGCQLAYEQGRWGLSWQGLLYDWSGLRLNKALGAGYHSHLQNLSSYGNTSLAYRYTSTSGQAYVSGEVAMAQGGAMATLHRLMLQGFRWGSLSLSLRYVSQDYWAYLAQADTHFARPHNELGIRWGIKPNTRIRGLKWQLEGDWFRSLSPKRGNEQEEGISFKANADYKLNPKWSVQPRLSYRNYKGRYNKLMGAVGLQYRTGFWRSVFKAEVHRSRKVKGVPRFGYVLSTRLDFQGWDSWQLGGMLSLHRTEDWLNRAYSYEPRLSEQYGSTILYGRGLRVRLNIKKHLSPKLEAGLNASWHYRQEEKVHHSLIALQLIYKS